MIVPALTSYRVTGPRKVAGRTSGRSADGPAGRGANGSPAVAARAAAPLGSCHCRGGDDRPWRRLTAVATGTRSLGRASAGGGPRLEGGHRDGRSHGRAQCPLPPLGFEFGVGHGFRRRGLGVEDWFPDTCGMTWPGRPPSEAGQEHCCDDGPGLDLVPAHRPPRRDRGEDLRRSRWWRGRTVAGASPAAAWAPPAPQLQGSTGSLAAGPRLRCDAALARDGPRLEGSRTVGSDRRLGGMAARDRGRLVGPDEMLGAATLERRPHHEANQTRAAVARATPHCSKEVWCRRPARRRG
jgi:hypothetical protein